MVAMAQSLKYRTEVQCYMYTQALTPSEKGLITSFSPFYPRKVPRGFEGEFVVWCGTVPKHGMWLMILEWILPIFARNLLFSFTFPQEEFIRVWRNSASALLLLLPRGLMVWPVL